MAPALQCGWTPAPLSLESSAVIWFQNSLADPDALYARRADLASAQAAARVWDERLRQSGNTNFEAAWKLSRAEYWLGSHLPEGERRAALEHGIAAGQAATAVQPRRPEGHFWTAANMGTLAESFGLRQGLKYRATIKRELETVLKIDPGFQQGSADRALGRWYSKVPWLFGGSNEKSIEHLQRSLTYDPTNHASLFFLAETLRAMGRTAEARAALTKLIAAPTHAEWEPEDQEYKQKARAMLNDLSRDVSGDRAIPGP
jgi:tetratricopeptide (TPR) repeat protein